MSIRVGVLSENNGESFTPQPYEYAKIKAQLFKANDVVS